MSIRSIILVAACLFLISCQAAKEVDITADWSASQLFSNARGLMLKGNYLLAIERYETLESRFPFGKYATQAQLDAAYAYYKFNEPDSALAAVERFIKLNPRHETVDYAYYLRGLINISRGNSIFDAIHERDVADFDRSVLLTAYNDFQLVVSRFPKSTYTTDSRQRIIYLRNQLANAELKIARYYASREAWVAASNRTKGILLEYQGTTAIKPSLEIQLLAYQKLGLDKLAADTQRIIDLNYKNDS